MGTFLRRDKGHITKKLCFPVPFLIKGRNTIAFHFRLPNAANYYLSSSGVKTPCSDRIITVFSGIITSEL